MTHTSALVRVSAVQLTAGLAGLVVALRRERAFDIPFLQGDLRHVARDSLWGGTSFSAPAHMLVAQAWATAQLTRGPHDTARRTLMWLGVVQTPGYLAERWSRIRLTPRGFDPVETPIVVLALAGAVGMAALGRRAQSRP